MKMSVSISSPTSGLSVSRSAILLLGTFLLYRAFQVCTGLDGILLRDDMLSSASAPRRPNSDMLLTVPTTGQMRELRKQDMMRRTQSHNQLSSSSRPAEWKHHGKSMAGAAIPDPRTHVTTASSTSSLATSITTSTLSSSSSSTTSIATNNVIVPSNNDDNQKRNFPVLIQNVSTPYFILHIGPPKTATTSIQCGLNRISRALAKRDNYYFLGNACKLGMVRNMSNGEQSILTFEMVNRLNQLNVTYLQNIYNRVQDHRRMGHHVILSSEHFTSKMKDGRRVWAQLKQLTEGFKVKVVVTYRHYFQWITSMYYQQHYSSSYRKWPHHGGKTHPTFQSYLAAHLDGWEASGRNNHGLRNSTHQSLWALLLWSQHFDDVHVFDLHQEGDTFTNFVCQVLPSADYACRELNRIVEAGRTSGGGSGGTGSGSGDAGGGSSNSGSGNSRGGTTVVKRVSSNYHADRVVEEAYQRGLIRRDVGKNDTLHTARAAIGRHGVHKDPDLMECIPPALEGRLRNASLTFLELLYKADGRHLSDLEWEEAVADHDVMLEESKKQGKYCDIHPVKFLANMTLLEDAFHPTHRTGTIVSNAEPHNDTAVVTV